MKLINIAHAGVITDAPTIVEAGMSILNFLLSVVGIVAIIILVIAGILYFVSAGDEKKMEFAKKIVKYAVLGVILSLAGMIIVKTVTQFFQ